MNKNFLEIKNVTFAASKIDKVNNVSFNIEKGSGDRPTYVISGDQLWYIDPVNDTLKPSGKIDDKFLGLNVYPQTTSVSASKTTSVATTSSS